MNGFTIYPLMPAVRRLDDVFPLPLRDVMSSTGRFANSGFARRLRTSSTPAMPGMFQSVSTTSTDASHRFNADLPSPASTIL